MVQCLFCKTISLGPQNAPQFLISLLHWNKISFSQAFFWGQQTASSCWGPDLENRVGTEAIQSAIHVVLLSLWLTCNTVRCFGERARFSSFVAVFWRSLLSNAPVMPYDICFCWFFLSQDNRWTKYGGQNPACWCLHLWSLWMVFTCCCSLSWLPIWFRSEVVDPCFMNFHIFMQKLLFTALKELQTILWMIDVLIVWLTMSKCGTHFEHNSYWKMFMQNGEYTAFWYLQLIFYLMQLQFTIGQNEFEEFLVISGMTAEFRKPEYSASFMSVQPHSKSAYHLLTIVSDGAKSE